MLPQWISQMDAAEDARRQALEDSRGEQEYNARVDKKVRVGCQVETSVAAAVAACKRAAISARRTQSNAKARVDKQTNRADWMQCALCSYSRLCCLLLLLLPRAAFVRLSIQVCPKCGIAQTYSEWRDKEKFCKNCSTDSRRYFFGPKVAWVRTPLPLAPTTSTH